MSGLCRFTRFCAAAAVALCLSSVETLAQGRAVRRAVANAVRDSGRPSLLEQMFSPGGAAYRNQSCITPFRGSRGWFRPAPVTYYTNGTPYDPYSQASLEDRYFSGPQFNAAPAGPPNSANAVNAYAPASFRMPGGGPSQAPPTSFAPSAPGFVSNAPTDAALPTAGAFNQTNIGYASSAAPPMNEAFWIAEKRRRVVEGAALPTAGNAVAAGAMLVTPPSTSLNDARSPSAGSSGPLVRTSLREGAMAFQRGEYEAAAAAYQRARDLGCADARALLGLGLAELARDRFPEAAAAIQAELSSAPRLDRSSLNLVRAYGRPEEFDLHLSRLAEAAAQADSAELYLLLGYLRYYSGDPAGGREAWSRYIAHPGAERRLSHIVSSHLR